MSIAEFLDGMPSFDERNFSSFHSDNGRSKRVPVYISTEDQPNDQIIVTDKSNLLLRYLHNQWDKKHGGKKRELVDSTEEGGSTSRKRARLDLGRDEQRFLNIDF
uniref:DET1- and DDB1-associated protein 1 n=1 Tax=Sipha flava TaxID=143950 RepID=A0A2S2Q942_9HEMI